MPEITFEEQLAQARKEEEAFTDAPAPEGEKPTVDETSEGAITAEMWARAQETLRVTAKKLMQAEVRARTLEATTADAYSDGYSEGLIAGELSVDCSDA